MFRRQPLPDWFAALVMISGGDPGEANKATRYPAIRGPGALDQVAPVAQSRIMVEALRRAGGAVVYTVAA